MAEQQWKEVAQNAPAAFSALLAPAADKLLELGKLSPDSRVLDVATGAGGLARLAARVVGAKNVTAIDASAEMIAVARGRAVEAGMGEIDFRVMDALTLDFPPATFDAVYCQLGLDQLADPAPVLKAVATVLKPGGRLALMVLGDPHANRFLTLAEQAMKEAGEPAVKELFSLGAEGRLEALLRANGFVDPATKRVDALVMVDNVDSYLKTVRAVTGWSASERAAERAQALLKAEVPGSEDDFDPYDRPAESSQRILAKGAARLSLQLVLALGRTEAVENVSAATKPVSFDRVLGGARAQIRELMPHEIKTNLKAKDVVFLDIREPDELAQAGKIPDSRHVPRGVLETRIAQVVPDKRTPVVAYCAGGKLSALAAKTLQDLGYENVWNILGGFGAWTRAGLPVEKK